MHNQKPWCVIKPENAAQITTIIKLADKNNVKIVPWGKGTKGLIGAYGKPHDVVVDMTKLNKVIEIDAENLTATLEAGVDFKDFQEMLYNRGYLLPVDPLENASSTIGGG